MRALVLLLIFVGPALADEADDACRQRGRGFVAAQTRHINGNGRPIIGCVNDKGEFAEMKPANGSKFERIEEWRQERRKLKNAPSR